MNKIFTEITSHRLTWILTSVAQNLTTDEYFMEFNLNEKNKPRKMNTNYLC